MTIVGIINEKVSPINEKLGVKINELEHSKNIKKEIIHKLNSSKSLEII